MKISIREDNALQLEQVYLPLFLVTGGNEEMSIVMRDSGFEFNYQGAWYSAKNGVVEKMEYNEEIPKSILSEIVKSIKS
jgi:hypothetical protein